MTKDPSTGSGQVRTEHYAYAATGLRRRKGETSYLWDGQNLLAELDGALGTLAQYTDFPGRWGGLSAMRRGGASSFYGFDMSANTRDLLDAAGAAEAYLYSAFGPELLSPAGANPYRFGGQVGYYRDEAERLYIRAREYAPAVGRWGSRDPIGTEALQGLYAYAQNRPTTGADATGLMVGAPPLPGLPWAGAGAAAGVIAGVLPVMPSVSIGGLVTAVSAAAPWVIAIIGIVALVALIVRIMRTVQQAMAGWYVATEYQCPKTSANCLDCSWCAAACAQRCADYLARGASLTQTAACAITCQLRNAACKGGGSFNDRPGMWDVIIRTIIEGFR